MTTKTRTHETVGLLQLAALVLGFAGMGVALGQSGAKIAENTADAKANAEAISELSTITRDLAGTAIRSESELRALGRRVELLEGRP